MLKPLLILIAVAVIPASAAEHAEFFASFVANHGTKCHDANSKKGKLDRTAPEWDPGEPHWIKVFGKVDRSEIPPPNAQKLS